MNLSELSDLIKITEHLRNVINTSGMNRFTNATITALKTRLKDFDEKFITEMLDFEKNNQSTAKAIFLAVQEARQKMGLDAPSTQQIISEPESRKPVKKNKAEKSDIEPYLTSVTSPLIESVEPFVEPVLQQQEVKKELSKVSPSSKQPYLEDESFAATFAAERAKIAKKRK